MRRFRKVDVSYTASMGHNNPCPECSEHITHYVWEERNDYAFAIPCGHGAYNHRQLTPEEIALAILMVDTR